MNNLTQKYMTKHTDKAGLSHLLKGEVKVGTLGSYQQLEGRGMLSSDSDEGTIDVFVRNPPEAGSVFAPSLGLSRVEISDCAFGPRYLQYYDEWIFCASYGAYSRDRHEAVVNGQGDYQGDKDYTEYVIFDVVEFCDALKEAVGIHLTSDTEVNMARVRYCDVVRNVSLENFNSAVVDSNTFEARVTRTFQKPLMYRPEDEVRVWVTVKCNNAIDTLEPLYVSSDKFLTSIKSFGSFS